MSAEEARVGAKNAESRGAADCRVHGGRPGPEARSVHGRGERPKQERAISQPMDELGPCRRSRATRVSARAARLRASLLLIRRQREWARTAQVRGTLLPSVPEGGSRGRGNWT